MNIDIHGHFIPPTMIDFIKQHGEKVGKTYLEEDGVPFILYRSGRKDKYRKDFYDAETILAQMKATKVDKTITALSPGFFHYKADAALALESSQIANDWVAAFAKANPDHFVGMATTPMQDSEIALKELKRAHEELGLNGLMITSMINEQMLDDEAFFPVYAYCAEKGIPIYLHPFYPGAHPPYLQYYTINLIGFLTQTTLGLTHLVMGGVFEKFPELKVIASHGGGYFPYQFGRLKHVWNVRPEGKVANIDSPEKYLKNLYFDTITHSTPALQFLVDTYGADHVVMGTDYPFDMADPAPVDSVDALDITEEQRAQITHKNAEMLFKL